MNFSHTLKLSVCQLIMYKFWVFVTFINPFSHSVKASTRCSVGVAYKSIRLWREQACWCNLTHLRSQFTIVSGWNCQAINISTPFVLLFCQCVTMSTETFTYSHTNKVRMYVCMNTRVIYVVRDRHSGLLPVAPLVSPIVMLHSNHTFDCKRPASKRFLLLVLISMRTQWIKCEVHTINWDVTFFYKSNNNN